MNGIEKDLKGTARVIRLDIGSALGRSGADAYGVMSVPTTLVLDGRGEVVHRETGLPDRGEVVRHVTGAHPRPDHPPRDELHDRDDLR